MRKTLRFLTIMVMFGFFGTSFAQDVEIPGNYIQNPNFEHTMNPIFWYGSWDWVHWNNSVAWLPEFWITDTTEVHSGKQCMVITENSWVWPTVTTVGFEEQDMKMSFWYKSPVEMMAFWMFFYRDAGLTREEIRPPIPAGYVGYDTAIVATQLTGDVEIDQSLYFEMWGPYPDWTYFEFTFSYPGTIPNPWVTLMFWSQYTPGFVDDVYYGLDFEGVYNGEESIELKNPDFEALTLGLEWTVNAAAWDNIQILNQDENHTPNGFQSIGNWDNWNTTYYMPAGGTEGDDMWMSFWHKGHSGSVDLYFYEDYGITKDDFPVPDGAEIILDSIAHYEIDTLDIIVDTTDMSVDTLQVNDPEDLDILELVIDTCTTVPVEVLAFQDFDTAEVPLPLDWLWSGAGHYEWGVWSTGVKEIDANSQPKSLWLPGDPGWTGVEGTVNGIVDDTSYAWTFMYKGQVQFELNLGSDLKYDLQNDPEGIVPANATVSDDFSVIHWDLDSDWWRKFSFVYDQGSWLADSSVASPASCKFTIFGSYDTLDLGFVDDIEVYIARDTVPPIVDTSYIVVDTVYTIETTYVTDTVGVEWEVNQLGVSWPLPAAAEWTQFDYRWTNPTGDIGSTLTMTLHADEPTATDSIIYFDDFIYGEVATSVRDVQTLKTLHLYPNPVIDMVYLSIEEPLARIDVYNSVGQLVKSLNNPDRKINMSDLKSGIYLMNVADQKGRRYESKFIKK